MVKICGKEVGPVGYGMHTLTRRGFALEVEEGISILKATFDAGYRFWNGGMHYGTPEYNSLHLLNAYFTKYPEDADAVVISIKGAWDSTAFIPYCTPEGLMDSVETCLRILDGKKKIDIFEPTRLDKQIPIEAVVEVLGALAQSGDIGGVGLTEVNHETIKRAHAVYPIAAVEIELSLFSTEVLTNGIVKTCNELGIPVVAYAPFARGWLTGGLKSRGQLKEGDWRLKLARFNDEVWQANQAVVDALMKITERKGCGINELALAWVVKTGALPIPGSGRKEGIKANMEAAQLKLTDEDCEAIDEVLRHVKVHGERYGGSDQKFLDG
ncbi:putative aldo/keto reductase [Glonium stellatum]|uniref:Putative aldo/keto reductase n=1 Tax=Glonium stellatum TaxID=574774 RepID=A0A8E2JR01_9PEZI|nr:putative aldo/keto reductase [Glonium stellatum]